MLEVCALSSPTAESYGVFAHRLRGGAGISEGRFRGGLPVPGMHEAVQRRVPCKGMYGSCRGAVASSGHAWGWLRA